MYKREMMGYIILLLPIRTNNSEGMWGLRHYDHYISSITSSQSQQKAQNTQITNSEDMNYIR
jgi:hypothetical protein